jgi:hypothetical protein
MIRLIVALALATSTPVDPPLPTATVPAQRLAVGFLIVEPVGGLNGMPSAPEGLSGCDEFDFYRDQAGLPAVFNSIVWRESRCRNDVHNSCCWGYLSEFYRNHMADRQGRQIYADCGVTSVFDYYGNEALAKQKQVCVAKGLYDIRGLAPWRQTVRRHR